MHDEPCFKLWRVKFGEGTYLSPSCQAVSVELNAEPRSASLLLHSILLTWRGMRPVRETPSLCYSWLPSAFSFPVESQSSGCFCLRSLLECFQCQRTRTRAGKVSALCRPPHRADNIPREMRPDCRTIPGWAPHLVRSAVYTPGNFNSAHPPQHKRLHVLHVSPSTDVYCGHLFARLHTRSCGHGSTQMWVLSSWRLHLAHI